MSTTHGEHTMEKVTTADLRGLRYGEILIATPAGAVDDYTSAGVGDCPPAKWDALDLEQIKQEWGATAVRKNGPRFSTLDSSTLLLGEPASFGGIEMRYASTVPLSILAKAEGLEPYEVTTTAKTHRQMFAKGNPVFELVDAKGHVYVMMSSSEQSPIESLPTLGEKMKLLPEGWQYQSRILTEDLVLDLTPDQTVTLVGDEFRNYYNGIPMTM